jgi:hypothetical protein
LPKKAVIAAITTIDVLGTLGGVCALLMVAWALFLLQTRIISLQTALKDKDTEAGLNLEVQKALKLRVQSSVIALFVVALAFLGLSFYYVQSNGTRPVMVAGEIQSDENAFASIYLSSEWSKIDTTGGEVRSEFLPNVDSVHVQIVAPGREPIITTAQRDKDHREFLYFGPVKLGKKALNKPEAGPIASPSVSLVPVPN